MTRRKKNTTRKPAQVNVLTMQYIRPALSADMMDQPAGMLDNPTRGQLNREGSGYFPVPIRA